MVAQPVVTSSKLHEKHNSPSLFNNIWTIQTDQFHTAYNPADISEAVCLSGLQAWSQDYTIMSELRGQRYARKHVTTPLTRRQNVQQEYNLCCWRKWRRSVRKKLLKTNSTDLFQFLKSRTIKMGLTWKTSNRFSEIVHFTEQTAAVDHGWDEMQTK